jgi:hypothetical protein
VQTRRKICIIAISLRPRDRSAGDLRLECDLKQLLKPHKRESNGDLGFIVAVERSVRANKGSEFYAQDDDFEQAILYTL